MLQKNPDSRPSVRQIVKSEFIKSHICQLLSHTLKAGNGGVEGAPNNLAEKVHALDADEADKGIERARLMQIELDKVHNK